MVELREEELWVASCVQVALPGVTVGQHDDNTTPSMHDLDLSIRGSYTFGAMEVTADIDAELVESWKLLNGRGDRWTLPNIAGGWLIYVRPSARIKRLLRELPALLKLMEERACTSVDTRVGRDDLTVKAEELGVVSARQSGTEFPGSVYVMPKIPQYRLVGWEAPTGDALVEWVADWIMDPSRSDNLIKLRRSGFRERHLFIIVPGFGSQAPFSVTNLLMRADAPLPTVRPRLPSEVTHIWVMGTWANGHGFRWSPDFGWGRFAKVTVVDPSTLVGCTCG